MFKKVSKNKKGFSLVESMVAISILTLSISAAFTAVQSSLKSSGYAKDQIFAFFLAQEGFEAIKNLRDENALNYVSGGGETWLTGISEDTGDPCWFGGTGVGKKTCIVSIDHSDGDIVLSSAAPCVAGQFGGCPNIKKQTDSSSNEFGLLGYTVGNGWVDTRFKREIQLTEISSDREILVTINIRWNDRGVTRNFQITQSLFRLQ